MENRKKLDSAESANFDASKRDSVEEIPIGLNKKYTSNISAKFSICWNVKKQDFVFEIFTLRIENDMVFFRRVNDHRLEKSGFGKFCCSQSVVFSDEDNGIAFRRSEILSIEYDLVTLNTIDYDNCCKSLSSCINTCLLCLNPCRILGLCCQAICKDFCFPLTTQLEDSNLYDVRIKLKNSNESEVVLRVLKEDLRLILRVLLNDKQSVVLPTSFSA